MRRKRRWRREEDVRGVRGVDGRGEVVVSRTMNEVMEGVVGMCLSSLRVLRRGGEWMKEDNFQMEGLRDEGGEDEEEKREARKVMGAESCGEREGE